MKISLYREESCDDRFCSGAFSLAGLSFLNCRFIACEQYNANISFHLEPRVFICEEK
jgi:hypothetical protein